MKQIKTIMLDLDVYLYKVYCHNKNISINKLESLKEFINNNKEGLIGFYKLRDTKDDKDM